jgi:hypothetical protein
LTTGGGELTVDVTRREDLSASRRTWFSVAAVVFALIFGVALFGWIGLFFGWTSGGKDQIHRVHDIGSSGVATGIFVASPLLILASRRDDIALLQMLGVAALATVFGTLLALDWGFLVYTVILAIPIVVLLAISKNWRRFLARGVGIAPDLLIAAIASAPFWGAFALKMASLQRAGPANDPHVVLHHWTGMAIMGIGVVLMGALASAQTQGWRIVAWLTGSGSIVYGVASVVFATYPGSTVPYPGSEGALWGTLAIVWGIVFIALAERRARAT